jgi:hypothetical protein
MAFSVHRLSDGKPFNCQLRQSSAVERYSGWERCEEGVGSTGGGCGDRVRWELERGGGGWSIGWFDLVVGFISISSGQEPSEGWLLKTGTERLDRREEFIKR